MPYKSEKQRAFFHTDTAKKKGITEKEVKEFDKASKGKELPKEAKKKDKDGGAKVPPEKKKGYHGHEGSDHSHLSNQNLRGANMAHATKTVKLQQNYESCDHDSMSPEKLAPREAPERKERRSHDDHDSKMGPRKK